MLKLILCNFVPEYTFDWKSINYVIGLKIDLKIFFSTSSNGFLLILLVSQHLLPFHRRLTQYSENRWLRLVTLYSSSPLTAHPVCRTLWAPPCRGPWSCRSPWWCWACGRWWGRCSPKTPSWWWPGPGRPSQGPQPPWPRPISKPGRKQR